MIQLIINGEACQFEVNDLQELLKILHKDGLHFAVAVNEIFISKADYFKTLLNNGDKIEIVQPMQGG